MTRLEWAENEIAIASKGDESTTDTEFDYAKHCFDSALKAYKSLLDDNHSGASWGITRQILTRFLNSVPLTPIEDTEDVWEDCSQFFDKPKWQCKRCSSFFKEYDEEGNVIYEDNSRTVCIDTNGSGWHNGLASMIVDEMFPIMMPYMPADKPFKIYREEYCSKGNDGEKDIVVFTHIIKPDGIRVEVGRYFKEVNNKYEEISKEDFDKIIREHKGIQS